MEGQRDGGTEGCRDAGMEGWRGKPLFTFLHGMLEEEHPIDPQAASSSEEPRCLSMGFPLVPGLPHPWSPCPKATRSHPWGLTGPLSSLGTAHEGTPAGGLHQHP